MSKRQILSQSSYVINGSKPKFKVCNTQEVCTFKTCQDLTVINVTKNFEHYLRELCNNEKKTWISEFKIMAGHNKSFDAMYSNNCKYVRRPITPFLISKTQNVDVALCSRNDVPSDVVTNAQKQCYRVPPKPEPYKTIGTQTDYRDSESQTIPWEPPYKIKPGHNPEVLTIAHFTWNDGLPPGTHELEVINKMRMNKAWEAVLPPMDTPANIRLRTSIITALEIDKWAFRESEIQAIMDYRLELMDEISKSREYEKERKVQDRFDRLQDFLSKRRDKEANNIKHNLRRELRKLRKKRKEKQQPGKRDIIEEHANPLSELYAPQIRHGEHPRRRHEVIQKELLKDAYIESVDKIDTLPNWLPTYEDLKAIKPKPKPSDLCIRETRWTDEKLKQLHSDLKEIRLNVKTIERSTLLKRKYKPPTLPSTPCTAPAENTEVTQIDQLSTLIQKIVRGRAIQCMMFEGRNRCRELIKELQSSHGLEEGNKKQRQKERERMIELQRLQNKKSMQEDRLCEILNSLEGITISGMLDFLSKELVRLEDERRIHAFILLAERERAMKEAAEAGRRQLEYNRRREFDEMFRQITKVNQESVETYLEDVIKEGIDWVSDKAAKEYVLDLCDKVESIAKYAQDNATRLEKEELVANMIYNFVLPEVEKNTVRNDIKERQQSYLRNAHAVIYDQILNLPPVETTNSDAEEIATICKTVNTAEEELKSVNVQIVEDIKLILENIISNAVSTSTYT